MPKRRRSSGKYGAKKDRALTQKFAPATAERQNEYLELREALQAETRSQLVAALKLAEKNSNRREHAALSAAIAKLRIDAPAGAF
jgi:hypothetical protein